MANYENTFICLAPELKIKIFQALPNLHSAIALRLTCSKLNALYLRYERGIRAALRDRIVQTISSYYVFLTTLHIPWWALQCPPSGGWPHITPQSHAGVEKTDFVIEVLSHLPYIAETTPGATLHDIELTCYVLDYTTWTPEGFRAINAASGKHMALIATSYTRRGMKMVLDTMRAEINIKINPYAGDYVMDIEEYFGMMVERCRNLELMFVPGHETIVDIKWKPEDGDGSECPDDLGNLMAQEEYYRTRRDARWIRYLYRKAGWPGPDFQKERALRAVKMFVEARSSPYPRNG